MTNIKEITYKDYGKCLSISNDKIEAVVTLEYGPRIVFFGFIGGTNIMNDEKDYFESMSGEQFDRYFYKGAYWNSYGGHRMWISPEHMPKSYYPDNDPVEYKIIENGVILTPPPQKYTGIAIEIELILEDDLFVNHKATNIAKQEQEFAIWALTVCARNGIEIIPMNTHDTGLLSNRIISVWPYTHMNDERLFWGEKFVTLKQTSNPRKFKLGFDNMSGDAYYVVDDTVFCKKYAPNHPDGNYPDGGVSFETYSCDGFTECETLGELTKVQPGETILHIEKWSVCKKPCELNERDDESIENFVSKLPF